MDLSSFTPRQKIEKVKLDGKYVSLFPFDIAVHPQEIYSFFDLDPEGDNWRYLPYGPFTSLVEYEVFCQNTYLTNDPIFFAIIPHDLGKAAGVMSLMRMDSENGVVETGHLSFTPALQRTKASTETIYLLGCYVFDVLGYRRFEWKCNNANEASKKAALRFGFTFEGVFRQHMVVKGQNRDTAWFSILDHEWLRIKQKFEAWLDEKNFDEHDQQIRSLASC